MQGGYKIGISIALAVLVATASAAGLFWPPTYARETALWAAEGQAGDVVNLFLVVPLIVAVALWARRGSLAASIVWLGTLLYLIYSYVIYTMAVHFNALFLVYTAVLGLSFYAFILTLLSVSPPDPRIILGPRLPVKTAAGTLCFIAFGFGAKWLGEILPALLTGGVPPSIVETGLPTNPVYVIDLAVVLPGFVIVAIFLLRREPWAFVLAPTLLAFSILMMISLAGLIVFLGLKGFGAGYPIAIIFLIAAFFFAYLLARFLDL